MTLFASASEIKFGPGAGYGHGRVEAEDPSGGLASDWSLVLDADALTLIAGLGEKGPAAREESSGKGPRDYFDPHPKEASRLLGGKWLKWNEIGTPRAVSSLERFQCFVC